MVATAPPHCLRWRRCTVALVLATAVSFVPAALLSWQRPGVPPGCCPPSPPPWLNASVIVAQLEVQVTAWRVPLPLTPLGDNDDDDAYSDGLREPVCRVALGVQARRHRRHVLGACGGGPLSRAAWTALGAGMSNASAAPDLEPTLDLENVVLDFGRAAVRTAGPHRGFPRYQRGALTLQCAPSGGLAAALARAADGDDEDDAVSHADPIHTVLAHAMRADGVRQADPCAGADQVVDRTVVAFTRESTTASQYHNFMEVVGLYIGAVASALMVDDFYVLVMDGHHYLDGGQGAGNLGPVVQALTAFPVLDGRHFGRQRVCFRRLVFPTPNADTYFWRHAWDGEPCLQPAPVLLNFRARVLHGLGLVPSLDRRDLVEHGAACTAGAQRRRRLRRRWQIVYLRRAQRRVLRNEATLYEALATLVDRADVTTAEFSSEQSVAEQAARVREADIVVATHGAALVNLLFARAGTGVVELVPRAFQNWDFYRNLAAHVCLVYRNVSAFAAGDDEDAEVDPVTLVEAVRSVLDELAMT